MIPRWFPFNIYNFASWARATMLPLTVLSARRAVRPLPPDRRLDELFPDGRERMNYRLPRRGSRLSLAAPLPARPIGSCTPIRSSASRPVARPRSTRASTGSSRHQDADGAWGGIQPPWIYSLMALNVEGYALDASRDGARARGAARALVLRARRHAAHPGERIARVGHAARARSRCRTATASSRRAMSDALEWLLDEQILVRGDWRSKVTSVEPSGWAFERANLHYPDIDDTAVVLIVLARLPPQLLRPSRAFDARDRPRARAGRSRCNRATAAGRRSTRTTIRQILTKIPFCDFGETLDPPSADVTAHVLEALGWLGFDRHHAAVERGYRFLRREQEPDGSWFGRWGVNHIYGTAAVLPALAAIGEDMAQPYVRRAADWIVAHQNDDGGWGETCASYMDDSLRGKGPSTASQTGWALMALLARSRDYERSDPPRRRASSSTRSATTAPGTSRTTRARASRATASARAWTSATEHARAHRAGHRAAARLHDQLQPLSPLLPADGARPRAQIPERVAPLPALAGAAARSSRAAGASRRPCAAPARCRR